MKLSITCLSQLLLKQVEFWCESYIIIIYSTNGLYVKFNRKGWFEIFSIVRSIIIRSLHRFIIIITELSGNKNGNEKKTWNTLIVSDSLSTLQKVPTWNLNLQNAEIWNVLRFAKFYLFCKDLNTVPFVWTPGHQDRKGNIET